jgi:hypothetical protein
MPPPNGPEIVAKRMAKSVEQRIDNIIWKIQSRCRSDSNELPDLAKEPDLEAQEETIDYELIDYLL